MKVIFTIRLWVFNGCSKLTVILENVTLKKRKITEQDVQLPYLIKKFLISTSQDIKYQLLRNKIKNVDGVFYTHCHADQTHGINDLRVFF